MRASKIYQWCCKISILTLLFNELPNKIKKLKIKKRNQEIRFFRIGALIASSLEKGAIEQWQTNNEHLSDTPSHAVLASQLGSKQIFPGSRWLPLQHTWDFDFIFPIYCLQRELSAPGCSWPQSRCSPAPLQPFLRGEQQNCNYKRKKIKILSLQKEREMASLFWKWNIYFFFISREFFSFFYTSLESNRIPWKENQYSFATCRNTKALQSKQGIKSYKTLLWSGA